MRYKTHPMVGWVSVGVALGCLAGVAALTLIAMNTSNNEVLVILGSWVIALWFIAVFCGIIAAHTIPNQFERKHAVRHAQRLADAMRWPRRPRTPDRP